MADRDPFELRLAAALRAYAEEAPTDVRPSELVHELAATYPGGRLTRGWLGLGFTPSLAWLLIIGLILLTVAAVGAGAAGLWSTRLSIAPVSPYLPPTPKGLPSAASCPPGSTPGQAGPMAQARPPLPDFAAPMAFDRHAGRLVLVASDTTSMTQTTWTFDVCTNIWAQMHRAPEPADPRLRLVYDVDSDVTIAVGRDVVAANDRVWVYDLAADTWTAKGVLPMTLQRQFDLAYDAASGLIVLLSSTSRAESDPWELWTYDVETDTWASIPQAGGPAVAPDHASQWLAYDTATGRLIWYELTTPATWLFDLDTGTWSKSSAVTAEIGFGFGGSGAEMAYDEASRQTVVFTRGRVIAYDAAADRWDVLMPGTLGIPIAESFGYGPRYADLAGPTMVYDSLNIRLIVYGGTYPSGNLNGDGSPAWVRANDVLAFDPVTRQWSVLVDASVVTPG